MMPITGSCRGGLAQAALPLQEVGAVDDAVEVVVAIQVRGWKLSHEDFSAEADVRSDDEQLVA